MRAFCGRLDSPASDHEVPVHIGPVGVGGPRRYCAAVRLRQYIVDAFVNGPFTGNPAAVCPLNEWIDDGLMQAIAAENNLSETAFFVTRSCEAHELRWFTPRMEVDLCGHATLAAAHVLAEELDVLFPGAAVEFKTGSGLLRVERDVDGFALELPASALEESDSAKTELETALGVDVTEVLRAGDDLIAVVETESTVKHCRPEMALLARVDARCVCVTSPASGDEYEYVVRVFAPRIGIDEDPATGSAQCGLAPYWTRRLETRRVRCLQASERGADLDSEYSPGVATVTVRGRCATFSRGEIEIG